MRPPLLAEFEALPDGVRYTRPFGRFTGAKAVAAALRRHQYQRCSAQIGRALARAGIWRRQLEQPGKLPGEFSEEMDDLPGYWEEETEEQQEAIAHQIEFMERN